jgi:hypothetical protein
MCHISPAALVFVQHKLADHFISSVDSCSVTKLCSENNTAVQYGFTPEQPMLPGYGYDWRWFTTHLSKSTHHKSMFVTELQHRKQVAEAAVHTASTHDEHAPTKNK